MFQENKGLKIYENDENFWKLKIMAFLHDPPNKAFLISGNKSHEEYVKGILKSFNIDFRNNEDKKLWEIAKNADHISSAEDRFSNFRDDSQNRITVDWDKSPVLKHPLESEEGKFDLGSLKGFDVKKLEGSINIVINDIVKKSEEDGKINYKKAFFLLWRNFNSLLKKQDDDMGALWDLLPAETRMPNHSIWHHNRMVSAIAGSLYGKGENSLVLMTIGPVQDFINTARSTADYWAGSYLLSYLSFEGMRTFAYELGPDSIIFPDLKEQPIMDYWLNKTFGENFTDKPHKGDLSSPSLPNRWLVICPKEHAQNLAKKAEENIMNKWKEIKSNCAKKLGLEKEFELLNKQDSFLEIYWVTLDLPKYIKDKKKEKLIEEDSNSEFYNFYSNFLSNFEVPDNFKTFYDQAKNVYKPNQGSYYMLYVTLIEKIMGARKAIRNTKQSEEKGYKCTLCGEREVIHASDINCEDHNEITGYWKNLAQIINEKAGYNTVKDNEMLCSVCLTKRAINKLPNDILGIDLNKDFPSVTEIAVADFKYKIAEKCKTNSDLKKIVNEFSSLIPSSYHTSTLPKVHRICSDNEIPNFAKIDGSLLFEETYDNENFDNKEAAKEALKKLLAKAKELGISKPSPYLGFIYFDGDKMGEWISGTHEGYPTIESVLHPDVKNKLKDDDTWQKIKNCKLPLMPSTQSAISSILLRFSLDVARVVAEVNHTGKLVYAGGDDVVIMAPLSEIMDIAKEIRECFSKVGVIEKKENTEKMVRFDYNKVINDPRERKEKTIYFSMGKNATGSAGIAIAHYHNSLKDSLNHARQAEKFAKNVVGRDGFGIALLKRSGEHSIFGAKWELLNKELSEIIYMIVSGVLSNQFITQLYSELETYFGFNENLRKEIIMSRAKYLAKRHIHINQSNKKEVAKYVFNALKKLNNNSLKNHFIELYKVEEKEAIGMVNNFNDINISQNDFVKKIEEILIKKIEEILNLNIEMVSILTDHFKRFYEISAKITYHDESEKKFKEGKMNEKDHLENLRNFLSFISFYSRNIKSDRLNIREEVNANA
ncbi:MAG: type III-B CRISPR-associated protein Cas10/Cmr2 [Candidatus Pacearchaeota archaeon]